MGRYTQRRTAIHTQSELKNRHSMTQAGTDCERERQRHADTCIETWTQPRIDICVKTRTVTRKDQQTESWTDNGGKGGTRKSGLTNAAKDNQNKPAKDRGRQTQAATKTKHRIQTNAERNQNLSSGKSETRGRWGRQAVGGVPRVAHISCLGHGAWHEGQGACKTRKNGNS